MLSNHVDSLNKKCIVLCVYGNYLALIVDIFSSDNLNKVAFFDFHSCH